MGSGYDFAAPLFHRLLAAVGGGDLTAAREIQFRAVELVGTLFRAGYLAAAKQLVRLRGVDLGPVRLPLANLIPEQAAAFLDEFERLGGAARYWGGTSG